MDATTITEAQIEEVRKVFSAKMVLGADKILDDLIRDLYIDGTIEDKRKFISMVIEHKGWKAAAAKDPYAHLPAASVQINIVQRDQAPVALVDIVADAASPDTLTLTPTLDSSDTQSPDQTLSLENTPSGTLDLAAPAKQQITIDLDDLFGA